MKKFLIALIAVLGLSLAGCSAKSTDTTAQNTTAKEATTTEKKSTSEDDLFWDADGNGTPDWQEEKITLKYATWQYNTSEEDTDRNPTIDELMIQAFTEKYPNITVEMQVIGEDYEWDTNLEAQAEIGNLPDVFLIYRLESELPYNLLADITEYYNHDSDTQYIFQAAQNTGVYNGVRYAVPTFIYPYYWFVNLDILQKNGIKTPSYNWTWDQMEAIAKQCYNESTHTVGQYGITSYLRELPKILSGNSNWWAYAFDGEKFDFGSEYYEQAFTKLNNALSTNAVTMTYSEDQLTEYYNSSSYDPRYDGSCAIWCSPSWEAKEYFETMNFNYDVYPAPGGSITGNIDIAGVSSTCAHKAAAYQLLKWMSYSEEGLITRYALYEEYGDILFKSANNYPYPIVDYGIDKYGVNKVWDNIPYKDAAGMTSSQLINALKNAAILANKETPGWDATFEAIGEYLTSIYTGTDTYANLKQTIIDVAGTTFKNTRAILDEALKQ